MDESEAKEKIKEILEDLTGYTNKYENDANEILSEGWDFLENDR